MHHSEGWHCVSSFSKIGVCCTVTNFWCVPLRRQCTSASFDQLRRAALNSTAAQSPLRGRHVDCPQALLERHIRTGSAMRIILLCPLPIGSIPNRFQSAAIATSHRMERATSRRQAHIGTRATRTHVHTHTPVANNCTAPPSPPSHSSSGEERYASKRSTRAPHRPPGLSIPHTR